MKKKIGIMTFHASNNSGSMLQAYALQHFFRERYKIDTEIIDYSNEVQQRMYSILCKPKTFKDLLRDILYLSHYKSIARTEKGYDEFKKYYKLSKKYRKSEDLKIDESEYLAIIAGSDQVWNINAMDFDENYMLPFENIKKIAYAVSLGASNPNESINKDVYKSYIEDFSAISVREQNAKKWIENLIGRKVNICVDPTLLISEKEWLKITDESMIEGPYIFWYAMTYKAEQANMLKKLSEKYDMPVYIMNGKEWARRGLRRKGIKLSPKGGPSAFLSLVSNATMVVTSSFHGSVFSYVFKKNFWYIGLNKDGGDDDRASFLLKQMGLSERYIETQEALEKDLLKVPEYDDKKLQPYVEESINFIEQEIVFQKGMIKDEN